MSGPAPAVGRVPRLVALAAMVLSVTAVTIYVVILLMGFGGNTDVARAFGPFGIVATVLGLIAAIWAAANRDTRAPAVVSLAILVPCVFFAAISLLVLLAPAG